MRVGTGWLLRRWQLTPQKPRMACHSAMKPSSPTTAKCMHPANAASAVIAAVVGALTAGSRPISDAVGTTVGPVPRPSAPVATPPAKPLLAPFAALLSSHSISPGA